MQHSQYQSNPSPGTSDRRGSSETRNTLHIYTWNPPFDSLDVLTLTEKTQQFIEFVKVSQAHFLNREPITSRDTCIIIAPDLLFSPMQDSAVHTLGEKMALDEKMAVLKPLLSIRSIVIAGSIEFLMEDASLYGITSHVITSDAVKTYDKKHPVYAGQRLLTEPIHTSVVMYEGKKSGLFEFRNLTIGLEICQDHEKETLKKELGNEQFVDLQILLTAGQSIHKEHVCTPVSRAGVLVQCELKPHITYDAGVFGSKELETAVYTVQKEVKEPSFRARFLQELGKRYDIKLHQHTGEDIGFDIKHTIVALQLKKQLPSDLVVDVLNQLIQMPEWSPLTKKIKIPFFSDKSAVEMPEGFNEIKSFCDAYYRGTLSQAELFKNLNNFAAKKLSEWTFTRHSLTEKLYQTLASVNEHTSEKELLIMLTNLKDIMNELTQPSVPDHKLLGRIDK